MAELLMLEFDVADGVTAPPRVTWARLSAIRTQAFE
jgi:hypothetical protein